MSVKIIYICLAHVEFSTDKEFHKNKEVLTVHCLNLLFVTGSLSSKAKWGSWHPWAPAQRHVLQAYKGE